MISFVSGFFLYNSPSWSLYWSESSTSWTFSASISSDVFVSVSVFVLAEDVFFADFFAFPLPQSIRITANTIIPAAARMPALYSFLFILCTSRLRLAIFFWLLLRSFPVFSHHMSMVLPSLNDISLMFVPFYAYFSLTLTYFFMRKQSFPTSLEFFKFKALYNYSPELPLFSDLRYRSYKIFRKICEKK